MARVRATALALAWAIAVAACSKAPPAPDPAQRAEGNYLRGTEAYLRGDFERALAAFDEVRKDRPDDPRLPAAIGEVHWALRKLPEALQDFREAARIDPKRATNWTRIGAIELQLRDPDQAKVAFQRAVALNARDDEALEGLGELALSDADLDGGVAYLERAAALQEGDNRTELTLRAATQLTRNGRRTDAEQLLERAITRDPSSVELTTTLADLRIRDGALDRALALYRDAAGRDPKDPTLWEVVATLEERLGHAAAAQEAYRRSLQVKDRATVRLALARTYLRQAQPDAARREVDAALAVATGELAETLDLVDVLAAVGRAEDALRLVAQLAQEPENASNAELQLKLAQLARVQKRPDLVSAACDRLRQAAAADGGTGAGTARACP